MKVLLGWPDPSLMPNRKNGRSWRGTDEAKKKAKKEGYYATKSALREDIVLGETIPLRIMFGTPDKHRRDADNLLACIKNHIDGIAQALGVDDSRFRPLLIDVCLDEKKQGFVQVEIGGQWVGEGND